MDPCQSRSSSTPSCETSNGISSPPRQLQTEPPTLAPPSCSPAPQAGHKSTPPRMPKGRSSRSSPRSASPALHPSSAPHPSPPPAQADSQLTRIPSASTSTASGHKFSGICSETRFSSSILPCCRPDAQTQYPPTAAASRGGTTSPPDSDLSARHGDCGRRNVRRKGKMGRGRGDAQAASSAGGEG